MRNRAVIEGDLRVERVNAIVGSEDQRVDLHEIGVAVDEHLVQLMRMSTAAAVALGFNFADSTHARHAASLSPSTGSTSRARVPRGSHRQPSRSQRPARALNMPRYSWRRGRG